MSLIFDGRFNSGARMEVGTSPGYSATGSGLLTNNAYVQDPLRKKGLVARMTVVAGQALFASGHRTEASLIQTARGQFVYHNSVAMLDGWDGDWPYTIIYQQHGNDSTATYGRPPCIEIGAYGPRERCYIKVWSRTDPTASSTSKAAMTERVLWAGYVDMTDWLDITLEVNWQYDSTGWINLYFNGKKVAGFTGAGTCYNEPEGGPFHKFGTYVQIGAATTRDVTTYHTGTIIATTLADITTLTGQAFSKQLVPAF